MAKNLAELCSGVLWKTEVASDEIMHSAEEISQQSVEGAAWFLLIASSEMRKERDELKRAMQINTTKRYHFESEKRTILTKGKNQICRPRST